MSKKDKIFISITILTSTMMFIFVFWLGFPGYFQTGDIYNSLSVTTDHWHPVFIAKFIQFLYFLFGKHSFYLFALNILCFYVGFSFFIIGLYIRTKSVLVYAIFIVTIIGNIFFQNFVQYHSFTFPMLLWLGCSMVFFQILVPVNNTFLNFLIKLITFIIFFFALLWRHNSILSIYPLFIIFIYLLLKRFHMKDTFRYTLFFIFLMLISACFLVLIVNKHPYILSKNVSKTTANHVFLHQIAGIVVPENDENYIPQEWYEKNKNFRDVKEMYAKYPTTADPFNVGWEPYNSNRPFLRGELFNLKRLWLKAIVKYPKNYLRHISRFYKEMWFQQPGWIFDAENIQVAPTHPWHISIASNFPKNERKITFSPLQKIIYNYLYNHKFLLIHSLGVLTGFGIFLISGGLWIFFSAFRDDILLFAVGTSFSTCSTAVMLCVFTPYPDPRYMSPVVVLSLISFIGFAAFIYLFAGPY